MDRLPEPPVIVATSLAAARHLLGDDTLGWDSGRAMLLDLGYAGWRDRQVWRRQAIANARSTCPAAPGPTDLGSSAGMIHNPPSECRLMSDPGATICLLACRREEGHEHSRQR